MAMISLPWDKSPKLSRIETKKAIGRAKDRIKGKSRVKQPITHKIGIPFMTAKLNSLKKWLIIKIPTKTMRLRKNKGMNFRKR